ncbi:MAG: NAD(P)/FAD-dependent oxidoreductase [Bacteroidales bacterium]|nr:NAD(P)/FAD-dependent oxidoreductase [Bacteroidales bacterium]
MRTLELTCPIDRPMSREAVQARISRITGRRDLSAVVVKRSIDARGEPVYRYRVDVYEPTERYEETPLAPFRDVHNAEPVIVVGAGPAGMFAALRLLTLGRKPVVLERGKDVHARKIDMALLSREGAVNPDSNYCFGEGGAGAFSDGKLYTRSTKRGDNMEVLRRLVQFGASPDILIDAHPHIGSDKLPVVVENIRKCVVDHGGEYHFDSRVVSVAKGADGLFTVRTAAGSEFKAAAVILATGHSARDVYEMLAADGGALEAKGFALGVRAEHPQSLINRAQFHGRWHPGIPAAEYSFALQEDGRGVFSFCMCPGGILVPSATKPETVVLNGMSNSARNSRWANAGVVVQIEPSDIPGDSPFKLYDFQQKVERDMYRAVREALAAPSGFTSPGASLNPMAAPAQRMTDFCEGRLSGTLPESSYHPGVVSVRLDKVLPPIVADRLRKAFPQVRIRGYYSSEAMLLGVESRTSSPIRIPRDPDTLSYVSVPGLFPAGEGAGYSGGIVSSAIDGIRCAESAAAA